MGWDAFSSIEKHYGYLQGGKKYTCVFPQKDQLDAFKRAVRRVKKLTGTVDIYLREGALDCRECARMLEKATGEPCVNAVDMDWNKRKVQSLAKKANWDFEYDKSNAWAYWSAKLFLETCAELRLSISMSN